jgi:hypothetical protein
MKKLLYLVLVACFLGTTPAFSAGEEVAADLGGLSLQDDSWIRLGDEALARALSVPEQSSDDRSCYGCGPNQEARICHAAGREYTYKQALDNSAQQGDLAIYSPMDKAMCVGPTCQQMARHINRVVQEQDDRGYKASSDNELDRDSFIANIASGLESNKPVAVIIKSSGSFIVPLLNKSLPYLHYWTIVGFNKDLAKVEILDTDASIKEVELDELIAKMNCSEVSDFVKPLVGLRAMFSLLNMTIAPTKDIENWGAYSYIYFSDVKEQAPEEEGAGECKQQ